jgi:hypothetical protein
VRWNHNRTLDLAALKRTPLASQLIFARRQPRRLGELVTARSLARRGG